MAFNRTIVVLESLTDDFEFERLCSTLLEGEFGSIVPLGGTGDRGRDAVAELYTFQGERRREVIFQYSIQEDWKTKLRSGLEKIRKNGFSPVKFVFVTNRKATIQARETLKEELEREYGCQIDIRDQEWLRTKLESPDYLLLRRQYLGIQESSLPLFLTIDDYLAQRPDRFLVDHSMTLVGRDILLERLLEHAKSPNIVLIIHGSGGIGKSRLVVELTVRIEQTFGECAQVRFCRTTSETFEDHLEELDPRLRTFIIVDDAHEFAHRGGLLGLVTSPNFKVGVTLIMVTRPVFAESLAIPFESKGIHCVREEVLPLSNYDIDAILCQPPFELQDEHQRGRIIRIAEGNPLIATMAVKLAKEGKDVTDLTRDSTFAGYYESLLEQAVGADAQTGRKYLAILAGIRGLDLQVEALHEKVLEVSRLAQPEEDCLLGQLVKAGIISRTWRTIKIVPDLLADYILLTSFFAEKAPYEFRSLVLEPFFQLKAKDILRNLAEAEYIGESTKAGGLLSEQLGEVRRTIHELNNRERNTILRWLQEISYLRTDDCLVIIREIVFHPIETAFEISIGVWGTFRITHDDVLREAVPVLRYTGYRGEGFLKETLNILYAIARAQDLSRWMQDPNYNALRIIVDILKLEPGKPVWVQNVGLAVVEEWLADTLDNKNSWIIMQILFTLVDLTWETLEPSAVDDRTVTIKRGQLKIDEILRDLRRQAFNLIFILYKQANVVLRKEILQSLNRAFRDFSPAGLSPENQKMLADDADHVIGNLKEFLHEGVDLHERFEMWKWGRLLREDLVKDGAVLANFLQGLETSEVLEYAHLVEWSRHLFDEERDWKVAQERHEAFWREKVKGLTKESVDSFVDFLNEAAKAAEEADILYQSAIGSNLVVVASQMGHESPSVLLSVVEVIPRYEPLREFGGTFLGFLHLSSSEEGYEVSKKWIESNDDILQREAARSYGWVAGSSFTQRELKLVQRLAVLGQPEVDVLLAGFPHALVCKLQHVDAQVTIDILKAIAKRATNHLLGQIAGTLAKPERDEDQDFHILNISNEDLEEFACEINKLPRFESMDNYYIELMLMRLFKLDYRAWLHFWEERIQRSESEDPGEFDATPYHLEKDTSYITSSDYFSDILQEIRDWGLREAKAFHREGAKLFAWLAGGPVDVVQAVLQEWIDSNEVEKHRVVARILEKIGYCDLFLKMAKELIALTDDELTHAYISQAIGTTGVVSGSLADALKPRLRMFESWSQDMSANSRVRLFGNKTVQSLSAQIERWKE